MLGKSGVLIDSLLKQCRIGLYELDDGNLLFQHTFPAPL